MDITTTTTVGGTEMESPASVTATPAERDVLLDLYKIFHDARGDHEMLADVRKRTAEQIDELFAVLASNGVDTDALLDDIDGAVS